MLGVPTGESGKHLLMLRSNSKPKSELIQPVPRIGLACLAYANLNRSHDKVHDQIKSHLASTSGLNKTYKRNVALANLLFSFKLQKVAKNRTLVLPSGARHTDISPPQAALMAYLSQYGHTASAFGDVK